ncbi:MAG: HEAT repeat domain-containing protein [Planctomycetaceae bacterium]|nr:HEAT repeat domain-containing protein [Planctomycetaceae bacterium]
MNLICIQKHNIKLTAALAILMCCCNAVSFGQEDNQLKINQWTLFNSTDEQIRVDTAKELIVDPTPDARKILLEALNSTDNVGAPSSVCQALSTYRSSAFLIPNRLDFILPLMNILRGANPDTGKLAAQAMLIFSLKEIKNYIDPIFRKPELPDTTRKNAVYALKLRPDKEAVLQLIDLLDSDDPVISSAAVQALDEWMPIGTDKKKWQKIRGDIERGKMDIVRERLLTGQDKIRSLKEDVLKWQKRYLASLDNIYLATTDDSIRAKFVAENLAFEHPSVKLWAIEKINMWQKSGKPLPVDVMQNPLVALVSDSEPEIRIAAIKLLGLLTNINSADALALQLKKEVFPDVKTEIIIALSHVCNFALSPGSQTQINPQIRIDTLHAAVDFFNDVKPVESAEVIRNLLLQNGLEESEVKPYFEYIAANYHKTQDEQIRTRLLEEMQRLCGNDSYYKAIAGEAFKDIFASAIDDKNSFVAEPAVSGLLRIDQAGAFALLKSKNFESHTSGKIRAELIAAAGQIGTAQDLQWLETLADTAETEDERQKASEAMMNIFQYCPTDALITWGQKLSAKAKTKKDDILQTKSRMLFEAAEKKAEAEHDANALTRLQRKLADSYADALLYVPAAKYYGVLLQNTSDPNEKEELTTQLVDVNIRGGQIESVKQLLTNTLLAGDIGPDRKVAEILNKYFSENRGKDVAGKLLRTLAAIELPKNAQYPLWTDQMARWRVMSANAPKLPAAPNKAAVVPDSNSQK